MSLNGKHCVLFRTRISAIRPSYSSKRRGYISTPFVVFDKYSMSPITVTPAARQSPPLHPLERTILVGALGTYLYCIPLGASGGISTLSFKLYHQSSEMSAYNMSKLLLFCKIRRRAFFWRGHKYVSL